MKSTWNLVAGALTGGQKTAEAKLLMGSSMPAAAAARLLELMGGGGRAVRSCAGRWQQQAGRWGGQQRTT
jgi:hypothetical protein